MTIALLTDLHFGYKSNNEVAFEQQMLFFEEQFFPYIIKNDIKDVICCGDIFDNRNTVGIYILQELRKRFFGWFSEHDVWFHNVLGNHDIVFADRLSHNIFIAAGLDLIPNIIIYNKVERKEIGKISFAMIPWLVDEVLEIPKFCDVVIGHFEMKQFQVTKGIESKSGFDKKEFADYKLVLSGHYHISDTQNNITYLGNPYQKDWGDFNLDKGFWTLDDKLSLTQHENLYTARHINLAYNDITDANGINTFELRSRGLGIRNITTNDVSKLDMFIDICKNNHVKFVVESGTNQKRIDKIYSTLVVESGENFTPQMINTAEVIEYHDIEKMENEIKEDSDVIGNMKLYTESVVLNENLDKELLVDMFHDIYKQTLVNNV